MIDTMLPPPERDLPPGRHHAMRAEILRDLAGVRAVRPMGPRTARFVRVAGPVAAAAAVAAVVFVAGVFVGATTDDAAPFADHPAVEKPVPGFTDAQLTEYRQACVKARQADEDTSMGFGVVPMRDKIDVAGLRVYNAVSDRVGTMVLLYTGDGWADCAWQGPRTAQWPAQPTSGGWNNEDPNWLPGAASIDAESTGPRGGKYWARFGGRVPAGVTRVEATLDGATASADVVNGTYLVTLEIPGEPAHGRPAIRTYDRSGKPVGTYAEKRGGSGCLVTPDGKQVAGEKTTDTSKCTEAVPWR
ncbi:hypothetical protein [Cryptosporangium sp. NPDC051539]|uniref:hypothetical protein n=1 Tax=Cryptosporangium sp. NPDC051539 TaxID=3363962 RepID=UPI0037B5372D